MTASQTGDGGAPPRAAHAAIDADAPLAELFWRDEVSELLFWRELAGLGRTASAGDLRRLLPLGTALSDRVLQRLHASGLLRRSGDRYELTARGRTLGARLFVTDPQLPALWDAPPPSGTARAGADTLLALRAAIDERLAALERRRGV